MGPAPFSPHTVHPPLGGGGGGGGGGWYGVTGNVSLDSVASNLKEREIVVENPFSSHLPSTLVARCFQWCTGGTDVPVLDLFERLPASPPYQPVSQTPQQSPLPCQPYLFGNQPAACWPFPSTVCPCDVLPFERRAALFSHFWSTPPPPPQKVGNACRGIKVLFFAFGGGHTKPVININDPQYPLRPRTAQNTADGVAGDRNGGLGVLFVRDVLHSWLGY